MESQFRFSRKGTQRVDTVRLMRRLIPAHLRARLWNLWWHWLKWPMPLWRLRKRATVTIAGQRFRFEEVNSTAYLEWVQEARMGGFEPEVVDFIVKTLRPGQTVVDVGAYVGGYALLASRLVGPTGKVVAVEPDPENRWTLTRNLWANDATNVEVLPYALAGHSGTAHLAAAGSSISGLADRGLDVRAVTLDELCAEHEITPDLIKIDIEGGEADVFRVPNVCAANATVVVEVHEFAGVDPNLIRLPGKRVVDLAGRRGDNYNVALI